MRDSQNQNDQLLITQRIIHPKSFAHKSLGPRGRAAFAVSPYPPTTYDKKIFFQGWGLTVPIVDV
jgi:hypothetical protein